MATRILLSVAAAVAALAAGCGGGSSSGGASSEPATTPVAVRVIDGAISNAQVCLDVNNNGACDAGEPTARTDPLGNATLDIVSTDAGKYPVLAIVGTDATDADHGKVTTGFVMKAPADKPAVVSPLTTLVQNAVEKTGATSDNAAANVLSLLGMKVSLFQDYTADKSVQGTTLGAVARMVVVTQQKQTEVISGAIGSKAIDGSVVTKADVDRLVVDKLASILPDLVQSLSDATVQAAIATGDIRQVSAALTPLAQTIVASPTTGITQAAVGVLVGVARQAAAGTGESATPTAGLTLNELTFTDAHNWFRRVLTNSAADVIPDAKGLVRFRDNRLRAAGGATGSWSFGNTPDRQSDLHWNGSQWVQCGLLQEGTATPRDAAGRTSYDVCDGFEVGANTRATFDLAGRKLVDVYNEVRDAGYTNISIADAATALGSAVFPAGSKVLYYSGQASSTAFAYVPNTSSIVRVYNSDALAAGTKTDCDLITSSTPTGSYTVEPATLEAMVARLPGTACAYQQHTITGAGGAQLTSGSRNEAWGLASLSLGTIGTAPLSGSPGASTAFWTGNQLLRVAFGANSAVKYYSCQQRQFDGSTRNCDPIGTGTYTITTVGDARVMALQNVPPQAGPLTYDRLFVERGGKVYLGYKNKALPYAQARFNKEAGNAFLAQLGAGPAVDAEDKVTLQPASWAGDWIFWPAADSAAWNSANAGILRIQSNYDGSNGAYQCFETTGGSPTTTFSCTLTLDPLTGVATLVDGASTMTVTLRFAEGTATGSSVEGSVTTAIQGRRR